MKAFLANDAVITGCQYADRCLSIIPHKIVVHMSQRPQHKTGYTDPDRKEVRNSLESTVTGEKFLNRTPVV